MKTPPLSIVLLLLCGLLNQFAFSADAPALRTSTQRPSEYELLKSFPPEILRRGGPDKDGNIGDNKGHWYEAGMQRGGMWYLISAVVANNSVAAEDAWRAIDATYAQQLPDGGFLSNPNPQDPKVNTMGRITTSFFWLNELSHALLVVQESPFAAQFHDRIEALKPKIQKSYDFTGRDLNELIRVHTKATNRVFIAAKAFILGGILLGNDKLMEQGKTLLSAALKGQNQDGIFVENGGPDTSYNAVSLLEAQIILAHLENAELETAVDHSMTWELAQIDPSNGMIDVSHNTRTGKGQETYMGHIKKVNTVEVALALCYYGVRKDKPDLLPLALKVVKQKNMKN